MNQPPSHMTIELEEKDVREDLKNVLSAMRKIRRESIQNNGFSEQTREEYLHLTSRLGSIIQKSEEQWVLDRIFGLTDGNNNAETFDTLQTSKLKANSGFFNSLQKNSILLLGHNYNSLDDAYHCLQAVKYLNTPDKDWEDHKKNCLSVKPFQEPKIEKRKGLKGLIKRLLGYNYKVTDKKGLEITLDGTYHFQQDLLSYLQGQGYAVVNSHLTKEDFKNIFMGEGKKERVEPSGKYYTPAKFTLLNLEKRLKPNFTDVFSKHASLVLPEHIEKNLAYKIGRPSLFGRDAKERIGIEEFDYKILSQILYSSLEAVAEEKNTFPKPIGKTQKDFERFIDELKKTSDKLRKRNYNSELFSLYKKEDIVVIARNRGSVNKRANDEYFYGGDIKRVPLGTIGKITTTEKNNHNNGRVIYVDLSHEEPFKLSILEIEPTSQTKKRFVDDFVEKAKETYVKEKHGLKVDFVVDSDRALLYYTTAQTIGDYQKEISMFLYPGKRTIVCGFQKGKNLEGIAGLGKKLISENHDAKDAVQDYLTSHKNVSYLNIIQFEDGKKVNDFEVRK